MQYDLCRHIRTTGLRCKSPALRDTTWCFYHRNLHQRHQVFRHTEATQGYLLPGQHLELAALEDRDSVQIALSVVINALATGQLETRRATAILYGLSLASTNAARLNTRPAPSDTVQDVTSTLEGLPLAEPATHTPEPFDPEEDEEEDDDEER